MLLFRKLNSIIYYCAVFFGLLASSKETRPTEKKEERAAARRCPQYRMEQLLICLSVAFVLLTVGLSMVTFDIGPIHCGFSLLLVCMMTGTVFCNICPTSDELMDRLDRWVSPVNILFFVLSGAELDLNILSDPLVLLIGVVYIAFRSLGKISGAFVSGRATHCSHNIQKYLGITLLPQAGVALGMAAEAAELSDGHMVRNVVLFSVLVYELVGPTLTKLALTAAGEIIPEGRTNARMANKPEFPVSLD